MPEKTVLVLTTPVVPSADTCNRHTGRRFVAHGNRQRAEATKDSQMIRNRYGEHSLATSSFLNDWDGRIALGTRTSGMPSESMTSAAEHGLRERLPAS